MREDQEYREELKRQVEWNRETAKKMTYLGLGTLAVGAIGTMVAMGLNDWDRSTVSDIFTLMLVGPIVSIAYVSYANVELRRIDKKVKELNKKNQG